MSNQNRNPQNGEPKVDQTPKTPDTPKGEPKDKTGFIGKILHVRDRIMASKAGRIAVRGLKIAGVGGLAYGCYKAGAKSVKPTTIYIREGVTEEETPEEPASEEEPEEEIEE